MLKKIFNYNFKRLQEFAMHFMDFKALKRF